MDKLVQAIQSLSSTENDWKQLRALLTKEEGILVKSIGVLDDVLNVLDPAVHSLGYAYILAIKTLAPKLDAQKFLNTVVRFLINCSGPQVKLVPAKFSQVCRKFAAVAIDTNQPIRAIKPLRMAILKLRASSDSLTPVHADFVQVCLLSKFYNAAIPILEEEVFDVNPETSSVTPKDFLLYYYYGGLVYTGLKDYKKAITFFRTVVTTPAIVLSAIMVEAYKKYLMLNLIVYGKAPSLPRYTSSVMQRHQKTSFVQYQELANAYSTNSTDELHKIAQLHIEVFTKDKNFGLVKQCIQSLYRRNILRHTQTYLTFSLQDIATSSKLKSPQEAEEILIKMIDKGEIFASINQKDGMVSFQESGEQYDTTDILNQLDRRVQGTIDLAKMVRTLDESISSSTSYLQKTSMHGERGRGWPGEFEEYGEGPEKGAIMSGGPGKVM